MHFNHPEILYTLLLLIIPILIHLFQLQRFEKIKFTNVKLLQEIEQQTRKSSKLKKWLILLTRLLLLASLIFAFSQPYFVKKSINKPFKTYIYLDNSLSMQAINGDGELFQRAIQDLLEVYQNKDQAITLFTNDDTFKKLKVNHDLLKIEYSSNIQNFYNLSLRFENIKKEKFNNNFVIISDFQENDSDFSSFKIDSLSQYNFVQLLPTSKGNIAIDSAWISNSNSENLTIKIRIKSYNSTKNNLSISFFINETLKGKTSVKINKNENKEIEFITPNIDRILGKFTIDDKNLLFDNTLYFTISKPEKKNILLLGKDALFMHKIYDKNKFNFQHTNLKQLEFSSISNQDLIILNEMESFSLSLANTIKSSLNKSANLVIIPSNNIDINSYNQLYSTLEIGKINSKQNSRKLITKINYEHPFFKDVFTTKIKNFQYPFIKQYYTSSLTSSNGILELENGTNFISEIPKNNAKIYWIASALNKENTNFTASPIVVPVFYNFAMQNTSNQKLYYEIAKENQIQIKTILQEDEVLEISKGDYQFIPLQINKSNSVLINTHEQPLKPGTYSILKNQENIKNIAFNYSNDESNINYSSPIEIFKKSENVSFYSTIKEAISDINEQNKKHYLWQLFIIFALLFLVIEIILQKFLKTN